MSISFKIRFAEGREEMGGQEDAKEGEGGVAKAVKRFLRKALVLITLSGL